MHARASTWTLLAVTACGASRSASPADSVGSLSVVRSGFIYESASFPSAHASTIVETPSGLIAAWFGGSREGARNVGIWSSRLEDGAWTAPVEIANGRQSDGAQFACYNPVLFRTRDGVLHVYFKVGPQPALWWGMRQTSRDDGRTWTRAERLGDGFMGPVKNKPVVLASGVVVSASSTETVDADPAWRVLFELSHDNGRTWSKVAPAASGDRAEVNAIQSSILEHRDGRLQAIGRSRSGQLFETWSRDSGRTWSEVALTAVPNPNAGTDAVTLRNGRHLLVYNNTTTGRTPLTVAISRDGRAWTPVLDLEREPGEYSYPAVIQTADGRVHVTYTWRRERIRYVELRVGR